MGVGGALRAPVLPQNEGRHSSFCWGSRRRTHLQTHAEEVGLETPQLPAETPPTPQEHDAWCGSEGPALRVTSLWQQGPGLVWSSGLGQGDPFLQ